MAESNCTTPSNVWVSVHPSWQGQAFQALVDKRILNDPNSSTDAKLNAQDRLDTYWGKWNYCFDIPYIQSHMPVQAIAPVLELSRTFESPVDPSKARNDALQRQADAAAKTELDSLKANAPKYGTYLILGLLAVLLIILIIKKKLRR